MFLSKFFGRNAAKQNSKKSSARKAHQRKQLTIELLEGRAMMAVVSSTVDHGKLFITSNNSSSDVTVSKSAGNIVVRDRINNFSQSFAVSQVKSVQFNGGSGNDRFSGNVVDLPFIAYGNAGDDVLEGYGAADYLFGGAGNDKLLGYSGNDYLDGGDGNDILLGGYDNDLLYGGKGDDHLNGAAGVDQVYGDSGNDTLIAIDNTTADSCDAGDGINTIWTDSNFGKTDTIRNTRGTTKIQAVAAFANGADRTLDRDNIKDPTIAAGQVYTKFAGNPLFSSAGPQATDIRQGATQDCYLLATMAGFARDNQLSITQNVVDFDDGTYGVRLGSSFYRVDNELAVTSTTPTTLAYAALGAQNSMWVAVVEKAFASYRNSTNSYAAISLGNTSEAYAAFNATNSGSKMFSTFKNATALGADIFAHLTKLETTTISIYDQAIPAGVPLVKAHAYTVLAVTRDSKGNVTHVSLLNPWGYDGAGKETNQADGVVTVHVDQLFALKGGVGFGKV